VAELLGPDSGTPGLQPLDMIVHFLDQFLVDDVAFGRPYHAARLRIPARARDTELHTHADFHEFRGIVSGTGEHLLTRGTQELRPRDVVLVRPSDRHAVRGSAPEGLEFVNVAFPTSAWLGFLVLTRTVPAAGWSSARGPVSYRATEAIAVFEDALDRFQAEPGPSDLIRFWIDLLGVLVPAADTAEPGTPSWLARACTAMRREQPPRRRPAAARAGRRQPGPPLPLDAVRERRARRRSSPTSAWSTPLPC